MRLSDHARSAANAARSHDLAIPRQFLEAANIAREHRAATLAKTAPLAQHLEDMTSAFEDFLANFGLDLPDALDPADIDMALSTLEAFVPAQLNPLECLDELVDIQVVVDRLDADGLWDDEIASYFELLADSLDDLAGVLDAIESSSGIELDTPEIETVGLTSDWAHA